mgnify:CR=1 FL=1
MIRVFESTDKSFTTNGDIVILPTKAKVTKKDNGDYYLDFEASTKYADYLTSGRQQADKRSRHAAGGAGVPHLGHDQEEHKGCAEGLARLL